MNTSTAIAVTAAFIAGYGLCRIRTLVAAYSLAKGGVTRARLFRCLWAIGIGDDVMAVEVIKEVVEHLSARRYAVGYTEGDGE